MTGEAAAAFERWTRGKCDTPEAEGAFLAGWEARGRADVEVAYRMAFDVDMDGDEEVSEVLVNKILTAIRSLDAAPAAEGKDGESQ